MRIINIKVIPNAKRNNVLKGNDRFKVYVTAPPVNGKANKAVIKVLAEYLKVKKRNIKIIKGKKSKEKIVEIK